MQARLFHLHALSALHCGTGQSVGVVDLPIARARATQLPIVPGSSLRGVLRQQVADRDPSDAETLFGPMSITSNKNAFAGALSVGDAHLLVLPVRCLAGIVSYVTSPFILHRYERDMVRAGITSLPPRVAGPKAGRAKVTKESVNCMGEGDGRVLVLEDLDLEVEAGEDHPLDDWANHIAMSVHPHDNDARNDLVHRFALLPDEIMSFLSETATEIRSRIAIDPATGIVRKGALLYEENLPAESVLWGVFALSNPNNNDTRTAAQLAGAMPRTDTLLQLGGHGGVGRGLVRFLTWGCRS